VVRNRISRLLLAAVVCVVSSAAVGVSSAAATPEGEYAVFAQCPFSTPGVNGCLVSRTESGEVKIGNTGVPIVATQTLQGGTHDTGIYTEEFVGASNGETLSKTPQAVPGGLVGLVKCNEIKELALRLLCEVVFQNGLTGVNATTELAAPASDIGISAYNLLQESGVGLSLPVKVKLENLLLGSDCYIGSDAEPIDLELTSGSSGSLKGTFGKSKSKAKGGILEITGNKLVDSGFAAPGATGCGGGLLDGIIDSKLGLPASTGNAAELNNTIEEAGAEVVEEL